MFVYFLSGVGHPVPFFEAIVVGLIVVGLLRTTASPLRWGALRPSSGLVL
jgi:hypothetical protein